jgi:hypothetical protein
MLIVSVFGIAASYASAAFNNVIKKFFQFICSAGRTFFSFHFKSDAGGNVSSELLNRSMQNTLLIPWVHVHSIWYFDCSCHPNHCHYSSM